VTIVWTRVKVGLLRQVHVVVNMGARRIFSMGGQIRGLGFPSPAWSTNGAQMGVLGQNPQKPTNVLKKNV